MTPTITNTKTNLYSRYNAIKNRNQEKKEKKERKDTSNFEHFMNAIDNQPPKPSEIVFDKYYTSFQQCKNIINPNEYQPLSLRQIIAPPEPIQIINIQAEINNINDLIQLTKDYPILLHSI